MCTPQPVPAPRRRPRALPPSPLRLFLLSTAAFTLPFHAAWQVLRRGTSIALGFAAAGGLGAASAQERRPHDPLTPAEREVVVRLARTDARVRQIAAGRAFDVAYAELLVPKLAGAPRQAEVLVSVFERRVTGIRAVVDLSRQAVVEVTPVERGVLIPFSPQEVELARTLALRSASVRALAGAQSEYAIDYLPMSTPEPELCPSGRCLELLFRRGNSYSTSTAVVEIPTQAVRIRRGPR